MREVWLACKAHEATAERQHCRAGRRRGEEARFFGWGGVGLIGLIGLWVLIGVLTESVSKLLVEWLLI